MTIDAFFSQHINLVQQIIDELPPTFDSHDFIDRFRYRFESDYIDFLYQERKPPGERGAFKKVHGRIARFLSTNASALGIEKTTRPETRNIFGNETENQGWRKL